TLRISSKSTKTPLSPYIMKSSSAFSHRVKLVLFNLLIVRQADASPIRSKALSFNRLPLHRDAGPCCRNPGGPRLPAAKQLAFASKRHAYCGIRCSPGGFVLGMLCVNQSERGCVPPGL